MHEMSLCESIRATIEEQSRIHAFARVARVRLEIGTLAGVEAEALRFGFDVVMRGSIAEGAELDIVAAPAEARCERCGELAQIETRLDACPHCGAYGLRVTRGSELRIKDLEVH